MHELLKRIGGDRCVRIWKIFVAQLFEWMRAFNTRKKRRLVNPGPQGRCRNLGAREEATYAIGEPGTA